VRRSRASVPFGLHGGPGRTGRSPASRDVRAYFPRVSSSCWPASAISRWSHSPQGRSSSPWRRISSSRRSSRACRAIDCLLPFRAKTVKSDERGGGGPLSQRRKIPGIQRPEGLPGRRAAKWVGQRPVFARPPPIAVKRRREPRVRFGADRRFAEYGFAKRIGHPWRRSSRIRRFRASTVCCIGNCIERRSVCPPSIPGLADWRSQRPANPMRPPLSFRVHEIGRRPSGAGVNWFDLTTPLNPLSPVAWRADRRADSRPNYTGRLLSPIGEIRTYRRVEEPVFCASHQGQKRRRDAGAQLDRQQSSRAGGVVPYHNASTRQSGLERTGSGNRRSGGGFRTRAESRQR